MFKNNKTKKGYETVVSSTGQNINRAPISLGQQKNKIAFSKSVYKSAKN